MIERLGRSLSFRLVAIFLLLALIFVYGATLAIRWVYQEDDLRELISGHLSLHINYVRNDIGDPPQIDRAIAITQQVPVDIRIAGPDVNWASDSRFPQVNELQWSAGEIFGGDPGAWLDKLENVEFAMLGDHRFLKIDQGDYAIIVASPRIADDTSGPDLLPIIVIIGLAWLFVAYVSVRWLFKPIGSIRAGAARIGMGEFEHRIINKRNDELGDLADDINKLADDVRGMLDAKRQLLLGISHELRSPLSRLRLSLEFLEDNEERQQLRAEILEMEQIISTLLEAERLNSRHAPLNLQSVRISDVVDEVVTAYFSRDIDRIKVIIDDETIAARVDESRLILLLKNLLSNALRYSGEGSGPVTIDVSADDKVLRIKVIDGGPGFTHEQAEHLGEPFYRGDPSRTRDTGGSGLGLYLTKLVAEAHGGSLQLDQEYKSGACLVVQIPRGLNGIDRSAAT